MVGNLGQRQASSAPRQIGPSNAAFRTVADTDCRNQAGTHLHDQVCLYTSAASQVEDVARRDKSTGGQKVARCEEVPRPVVAQRVFNCKPSVLGECTGSPSRRVADSNLDTKQSSTLRGRRTHSILGAMVCMSWSELTELVCYVCSRSLSLFNGGGQFHQVLGAFEEAASEVG